MFHNNWWITNQEHNKSSFWFKTTKIYLCVMSSTDNLKSFTIQSVFLSLLVALAPNHPLVPLFTPNSADAATRHFVCCVTKIYFPNSFRDEFPNRISYMLQFFSIAFTHFSIHCWLFQSSSHTAAHTPPQPLTEAEITKTRHDVCRMTPPSQNLSHTHQNQTFPSKHTISAQLKMYVFSFI